MLSFVYTVFAFLFGRKTKEVAPGCTAVRFLLRETYQLYADALTQMEQDWRKEDVAYQDYVSKREKSMERLKKSLPLGNTALEALERQRIKAEITLIEGEIEAEKQRYAKTLRWDRGVLEPKEQKKWDFDQKEYAHILLDGVTIYENEKRGYRPHAQRGIVYSGELETRRVMRLGEKYFLCFIVIPHNEYTGETNHRKAQVKWVTDSFDQFTEKENGAVVKDQEECAGVVVKA